MAGGVVKRTLKRAVDLVTVQTITSEALMAMHGDDYQVVRRQATRARLDRQPRYVCGICGHAVYAPREGRTGQPYWKHHPGASENCPWWTGTPSTVDDVSGRQFDGAQESPLHAKIKHLMGDLLRADTRTAADSVVIDEYLITETGRRRPDVRAVYQGHPLVVEVQLATTQIPIIVQREDFYEQTSWRLLWLTWNFEPPANGRLLSSFEDIFYSHDKNLFSMDEETIALSRQNAEVTLRAFWMDGEQWRSKIVGLSELHWLRNGRANAIPSKPPWHLSFLAQWRATTGETGTPWQARERLFVELATRLSLAESVTELDELDIDSLINCLLSLLDGHPVGSRQKNLVEMLNTFLNVERRHRYSRLLRSFLQLTGNRRLLHVESVRSKFMKARTAVQEGRQTAAGRIALALFPEVLVQIQK